jgi:hypothetical protein
MILDRLFSDRQSQTHPAMARVAAIRVVTSGKHHEKPISFFDRHSRAAS